MHQSVLQNVEIALTLSGVSKKERKERAIEVLKKVGLEEHIDKKPNQLSGGQMQRVAIARALVNNPEIILADEPTGALDSATSIQIMDLLKEIAKDKLVIMVTHNPELAKEYSTRIVELKDGLIINDSNPYEEKKKEKSNRTITKTSMSLLSALSLSFNNLATKKGRTLLTAFAGSIGIIGIALILSLANGVNNYAKSLERDSLTDYPITLERTSFDILGTITEAIQDASKTQECPKGKVCSNDDVVKNTVVSASKGIITKNNLLEFKNYIESNEEFKENTLDIKYTYKFDLQVYTKDYNKVNPSNILPEETNTIFTEITNNVKDYKVLAGSLPKNENEVVLIIGGNNTINDSILYSLGIKDRDTLNNDLDKIKKDHSYRVEKSSYSYKDFLDKEYKVILNVDQYKKENDLYIDYSTDTEYMKNVIDNGIDIKIVGVVQDENTSQATIGYTHDLVLKIIEETSKTDIYQEQMNNKEVNIITGETFDNILTSFEDVGEELAIYDLNDPSTISIYPKDFESKEKIVELIDEYNKEKEKNNQKELVVKYSDLMKSLVGGVTKVINIVSYVLIAFVAISLIVSSIMIAIITYISVLERTKEIGILRAIGASKKDIKRVFIAETIIEGFIAGALGIAIALLLSGIINAIVSLFGKINNIASMPLGGSLFLIALSILLNVIAGSKPSSIAAKKDPVESLRSE